MEKSFIDRYNEAVNMPTPRQAFLEECAAAAHVSVFTVKQWVYGQTKPERPSLALLAMHFNCDPETLFPTSEL